MRTKNPNPALQKWYNNNDNNNNNNNNNTLIILSPYGAFLG